MNSKHEGIQTSNIFRCMYVIFIQKARFTKHKKNKKAHLYNKSVHIICTQIITCLNAIYNFYIL